MKQNLSFILASVAALALPMASVGQVAPALGAASTFTLFTVVGAFDNVGPTIVNGDIGTNAGAFSGFPLGVVATGNIHVADTYSTQAAGDVQAAYTYMSSIPCVVPLAVYGGPISNPQVLTPNSYCVGGATTLAGSLILDGQNNPNALFFLRVSGALTTGANSTVTCINGASAANVYWQITGRTDLGNNSVMRGTLITDGAINLIQGATLLGRGLSRAGAITLDTNVSTLQAATSTFWLGSRTTDWYTASNWSAGVPTSSLDAVVPTGTSPYPLIGSGSAVAKSLTIGTNAALTQSGGTLDLKGALANSGTISATGGTVSLSDVALQNIGGSGSTQVWNLTVANTQGATQTGNLQVHGVLALTSGNLSTAGHTLTLLSDANGTALVANTNGTVVGNTTVQRYISPSPNAGVGYRQYSAPVSNTTVADLGTSGFTPTLNPAYNTSATPGSVTPFPTVFGYDESRVLTSPATTYSDFDKGWVSPAATDAMTPMKGYTVNIPASQKVDFVGTLNNGNISRAVTHNGGTNGGYNLLGNPYPSPLDWSQVTIPPGLDAALYVFQSTSQYGGSYRSYVNNVGNPIVPVAQGFFVRTSANTTLNLTNAVRQTTTATTPTAFQRGTADTRPLVQLTLSGANAALNDEAYVYFENGATAGIDAQYDARKVQHNNGGAPTVFALAAGTELSINGLPALTTNTTVALGVEVPAAGAFTFEAAQLRNLSGTAVYLHDATTGQDIDLSQQSAYTFNTSAAGLLPTRFSLRFALARPAATQVGLTATSISLYPNPTTGSFTLLVPAVAGATQVTATLLNSLGQQVRQQSAALPAAGTQLVVDAAHLAGGLYIVRVQAGSSTVTKHLVIQ